jgi:hypothetical protein
VNDIVAMSVPETRYSDEAKPPIYPVGGELAVMPQKAPE